jgi:hypothetical protein
MGTIKKTTTAAPKKRAAAAKTARKSVAKPVGKKARAAAVTKILRNVEAKMSGKDVKATLGDYIRLVQLQKEMVVEETPTDVTVMWVDPADEE